MAQSEMDALAPRRIVPVTEFDIGLTPENMSLQKLKSADTASRNDMGQLLILCLIERMCAMAEHDPDRNQKLLSLICSRLHQMGIISQGTLQISSTVRQQYSEGFNKLWDMAANLVSSKVFLPQSCPLVSTDSESRGDSATSGPGVLNVADLFRPSRFDEEFHVEGRVGSGAFGSVLKVRNRLDGNLYAIKKIKLRRISAESKVLREVTTLAKLDHPNVIRYNSAWLEYSHALLPGSPCGPVCRRLSQRTLSATSTRLAIESGPASSTGSSSSQSASHAPIDSLPFPRPHLHPLHHHRRSKPKYIVGGIGARVRAQGLDTATVQEIFEDDENGESVPLSATTTTTTPTNTTPSTTTVSDSSDDEASGEGEEQNSQAQQVESESDHSDLEISFEDSPASTLTLHDASPRSQLTHSNLSNHSEASVFLNDESASRAARDEGEPSSMTQASVVSVSHADGEDEVSRDASESCLCDETAVTLFIQMQLCEFALDDWLRTRDTSSPQILFAEAMHIFHQVVLGVSYIHSLKLIHRDIKPQNIFLRTSVGSRPVVKIGDFGLAREAGDVVLGSLSSVSTLEQHTSGVGTGTYAAPEQTRGGVLTEKSDIFSLGLLLFELLYVFHTSMERFSLFNDLRRQRKLPDKLVKEYPKESVFILWLTAPNSNDRPSAVDILSGDGGLFDSVILTQNHVLHLEQRLAAAETSLRDRDSELTKLRALLRQHNVTH